MRIVATSTAFPPFYFQQREVVEALKIYWGKLRKLPLCSIVCMGPGFCAEMLLFQWWADRQSSRWKE